LFSVVTVCVARCPPPFPYTTLFRSVVFRDGLPRSGLDPGYPDQADRSPEPSSDADAGRMPSPEDERDTARFDPGEFSLVEQHGIDRKSTRLNSSHVKTSYAVFCLKK